MRNLRCVPGVILSLHLAMDDVSVHQVQNPLLDWYTGECVLDWLSHTGLLLREDENIGFVQVW